MLDVDYAGDGLGLEAGDGCFVWSMHHSLCFVKGYGYFAQ